MKKVGVGVPDPVLVKQGFLPPDIYISTSKITWAGVRNMHWYYKVVYQADPGTGWYKLCSAGPIDDDQMTDNGFCRKYVTFPEREPCEHGWPSDDDTLSKNPPWRYTVIWYYSTPNALKAVGDGTWKVFAVSKSWGPNAGCYEMVWKTGGVLSGAPELPEGFAWLGEVQPPPAPPAPEPPAAPPPPTTKLAQPLPADKPETSWGWYAFFGSLFFLMGYVAHERTAPRDEV